MYLTHIERNFKSHAKKVARLGVAMLAVSLLVTSCASTGPKISKEELKRKEEEFNLKFFEASKTWLPRIYRVGYRLVKSPVPGHKDEEAKYNFAGVGVQELKDFSRKVYSIDKKMKGLLVLGLYPGSQAADSDIQPGDVIMKLGDKKIKNLGSYFKQIRKAKTDAITAEIWRKGETIEREIPIEKVYYNAQFFLAPTPSFDANSLFSKIEIGIGALRYCKNDDELAVIMGHELAHTTLSHSAKKLGAGIGVGIGYGAVAGVISAFTFPGVGTAIMQPIANATDAAISRRYEKEADYYGLQHAFHSGYDVENGVSVFSRLASDAPGFQVLAYAFESHPKTPERFLRFEKAIEELKTNYPEKLPFEKAMDWSVTVPVEPGETLETALERMLQEKKKKEETAGIPISTGQLTQKVVEDHTTGVTTAEQQTSTIVMKDVSLPPRQIVDDFSFETPMTNEIDTASPANPDTLPASASPAPKK